MNNYLFKTKIDGSQVENTIERTPSNITERHDTFPQLTTWSSRTIIFLTEKLYTEKLSVMPYPTTA